jgi:predicted nucleotidyltransferase
MSETVEYHGIRVSKDRIRSFCRRWKVKELAVFGSILRNDFRPESDIDVLVAFAPSTSWRVDDILEMKEDLQEIFGRSVDLVERRLVENSPNYIRRKHILNNLKTLYVA